MAWVFSFVAINDSLMPWCPTHKYVDDTKLTEILRRNDPSCMNVYLSELLQWSVLSMTDRQTDGWTDGQNSHRYTASAFYAARQKSEQISVANNMLINKHKKLIRRWDSERELSVWRHRTRTTKYNRLVHKFLHRLAQLYGGTHVFTKFSEITQYNGHYAVQGHSRSPILVPIESSYTTSY